MVENSNAQLRGLLQYAPETAGAMMEPRVTSIPLHLTVQGAIKYFRKAPRHGLSGAEIPLVLRALNRDTVTDVAGFAAFPGFAVVFMPLLI